MSDTKALANEAIHQSKKDLPVRMVYDLNTNERLGLAGFKKQQIDTLGYVPLSEKVTRLLGGTMDFHANEKELEFDEEQGSWNDPEPDIDPTNDMLDKTDVHDLHKAILDEVREAQKKNPVVTKVSPADTPEQAKAGAGENISANKVDSSNNGEEINK